MNARSRYTVGLAAAYGLALLLPAGRGTTHANGAEPLVASGTIQAEEVRVASEHGGRIVAVRPGLGEQVHAGDVLVELDATPLLLQLSLAEAAVVTARADLAVVQSGPRAEEIAAANASLALAKAQQDGALAAWQNALKGIEDPQELDAQLAQARTQVALAEQGVELAEAELASAMLWRDQQIAGSTQRRVADLQVQATNDALSAARSDLLAAQQLHYWLWTIRQQPLALIAQANMAEGQYRLAEAAVVVRQAELDDLLTGPTAEEVAVAEAAVLQAEAEAAVLQVKINQLTLTSPIDGLVLNQVLRPGELAAPAATILTLADLSQVTLVVFVPENRIGQVRYGQQVLVQVDSFPGRNFAGQVTRIGDQPEFTPRNVTTVEERLNTFYPVEIVVPNGRGLLKPGMPADATFVDG